MNTFPSPHSAQPLTVATSSSPAQGRVPARSLRAVLLGGLAVVGSMGSALAQEGPSLQAKQSDDAQSLLLTVSNPRQERLQMLVVALDQHATLVNEVNHLKSYGSKLVFNGLPAGQYAVRLSVGKQRYQYNVTVATQTRHMISVDGLTPPQSPTAMAAAAR